MAPLSVRHCAKASYSPRVALPVTDVNRFMNMNAEIPMPARMPMVMAFIIGFEQKVYKGGLVRYFSTVLLQWVKPKTNPLRQKPNRALNVTSITPATTNLTHDAV